MEMKKESESVSSYSVLSDSLRPHVATPWTVAHQAPLSLEFSRQEYWSGLPFPSPGDLPNPGIEPGSPALQEDSLPSEPLRMCFLSFDIKKMLNNKICWGVLIYLLLLKEFLKNYSFFKTMFGGLHH